MDQDSIRLESFIVRLKMQYDGRSARWVLRGQVEHAQTGQSWRFLTLNELMCILRRYLESNFE